MKKDMNGFHISMRGFLWFVQFLFVWGFAPVAIWAAEAPLLEILNLTKILSKSSSYSQKTLHKHEEAAAILLTTPYSCSTTEYIASSVANLRNAFLIER